MDLAMELDEVGLYNVEHELEVVQATITIGNLENLAQRVHQEQFNHSSVTVAVAVVAAVNLVDNSHTLSTGSKTNRSTTFCWRSQPTRVSASNA